jgi:hypothetical protein
MPLVCFQCGKEGHFAQNCLQCCFNANAATLEEPQYQIDSYLTEQQEEPESHITCLKAELNMMMTEDRERLAMEMGTDEDFPSA